MLKKGKYFLVFVLSMLFSCSMYLDENIKLNLKTRKQFVEQSFNKYNSIYLQANDSINKWILDSLDLTKSVFFSKSEWEIDSILIFNKDSTRFYTVINNLDILQKGTVFDNLLDFGGAKINGKWYFFFMGVYNPVRRENWQDSVYAPLSFEELSYVAYESHFKTFVKNINEGHSEKNEKYFNEMFFDYYECKDVKDKHFCSDTFTLAAVGMKYQNRLDFKEISDIKKSIAESKLPVGQPLVKSYSWWEKLKYGKKTFETEEWKDYIKQKYGE